MRNSLLYGTSANYLSLKCGEKIICIKSVKKRKNGIKNGYNPFFMLFFFLKKWYNKTQYAKM